MCNSRSALWRWKTAVDSAACQNRSIRLEKAAACFATQAGNLRFIHSGANTLRFGSQEKDMGGRVPFRKVTAAFVALTVLGSSAASAATVVPSAPVDPLVALSVFGTSESRAAVCAAGSSAAAAAGAAAAQAATGCVLPAVDAPPPPPAAEAAPPPAAAVVPVAEAGGSVFPILLGMAAIFGLASLAITGDHTNGEINLPVSP